MQRLWKSPTIFPKAKYTYTPDQQFCSWICAQWKWVLLSTRRRGHMCPQWLSSLSPTLETIQKSSSSRRKYMWCVHNEILHSNKNGTTYGQYNHRGELHIILTKRNQMQEAILCYSNYRKLKTGATNQYSGRGQVEVTHGSGINFQEPREGVLQGWTYSILDLGGDSMGYMYLKSILYSLLYLNYMPIRWKSQVTSCY